MRLSWMSSFSSCSCSSPRCSELTSGRFGIINLDGQTVLNIMWIPPGLGLATTLPRTSNHNDIQAAWVRVGWVEWSGLGEVGVHFWLIIVSVGVVVCRAVSTQQPHLQIDQYTEIIQNRYKTHIHNKYSFGDYYWCCTLFATGFVIMLHAGAFVVQLVFIL